MWILSLKFWLERLKLWEWSRVVTRSDLSSTMGVEGYWVSERSPKRNYLAAADILLFF